jgi:RNA polymerase sigma-70 factor (ECF subfamily)
MREADFDRLWREHAADLFSFLAYRTGDRGLAEDVLGEAFERAIRGRRGFDRRKAREKTWLYTIALNCLRDRQRRTSAEHRAYERVAPVGGPATPGLDEELVGERDALDRALAQLSDEEREAIALRFGGDLTIAQIAEATGESRTTVEGRVYRSLKKLKAILE